jgi:hypothetical protein
MRVGSHPSAPGGAGAVADERRRVRTFPDGRTFLWWGLGGLWAVDALLQLQPSMWSQGAMVYLLRSSAAVQPLFVGALLRAVASAFARHQLAWDLGVAAWQALVAVLLLAFRDTPWGRVGLWLSLAWSLVVWVAGEGYGGLVGSVPSYLVGAPGSALAYAAGSVLLLLPPDRWRGQVQRWTRRGMGLFWLAAAAVQAWPGYWTAAGLTGLFANVTMMAMPGVVNGPVNELMQWTSQWPALVNGLMVGIMALLGVGFLWPRLRAAVLGLSLVWLAYSWWLGQGLGVFGGLGTDPNLAVPLGILTVSAVLPPWRATLPQVASRAVPVVHEASCPSGWARGGDGR